MCFHTAWEITHWYVSFHDDVKTWKHVQYYWPFVRIIHWSAVNFLHIPLTNCRLRGAWYLYMLAWINCEPNRRVACDLRRHNGHLSLLPWRTIDTDTLSVLRFLWGYSTCYRWIPLTRAVMPNFDVLFHVSLGKLLNPLSICCWSETPWMSLGVSVMNGFPELHTFLTWGHDFHIQLTSMNFMCETRQIKKHHSRIILLWCKNVLKPKGFTSMVTQNKAQILHGTLHFRQL